MQKDHQFDEETLLKLIAEGSEYAFGVMFDRYRPKIYRLALKFLKSPALAEEIVQEVFLKIWLKRAEMDEVHSFDAYLFITAKNVTLDAFRKLASKEAAEGEYAATRDLVDNTIDYSMMDEHYQKMVKQSIALLPAQQARVFHMARIDGLSQEAIALQMSISKLTVKKHMASALQFLRRRLQNHLVSLLPLVLKSFD